MDLTDFRQVLHGPLAILYKHTFDGDNRNNGWRVTLDFYFVEGTPARRSITYGVLKWGSEATVPYGKATDTFEKAIVAESVNVLGSVESLRLKIVQTGHGRDETDHCAEFCTKERTILVNGKVVDVRSVWKECGSNPLKAQGESWTLDRANWCPGLPCPPRQL